MGFLKNNFTALYDWYKSQSFLIQLLIALVVLMAPSGLRYIFQHNSWATYTDERLGYSLEYPAYLWKSVSYVGFQGNREVHLLLTWPAFIEVTHQISVGAVDLENPTVDEVAAYYENLLMPEGWEIASDLETIKVNGMAGLTRTYSYSDSKYKQVYFANDQRGYFLRFTAASRFYESSLQDFNHVVATFRVFSGTNDE